MAANGTFSKSWKWESGLFGPVNGCTARFLHGSKRLTIGYENETTAGNSFKMAGFTSLWLHMPEIKRGTNFDIFPGLFLMFVIKISYYLESFQIRV